VYDSRGSRWRCLLVALVTTVMVEHCARGSGESGNGVTQHQARLEIRCVCVCVCVCCVCVCVCVCTGVFSVAFTVGELTWVWPC
jgi:hypothetical protein